MVFLPFSSVFLIADTKLAQRRPPHIDMAQAGGAGGEAIDSSTA
jgi:hypothetical protein